MKNCFSYEHSPTFIILPLIARGWVCDRNDRGINCHRIHQSVVCKSSFERVLSKFGLAYCPLL